jgi:hypothetical protein
MVRVEDWLWRRLKIKGRNKRGRIAVWRRRVIIRSDRVYSLIWRRWCRYIFRLGYGVIFPFFFRFWVFPFLGRGREAYTPLFCLPPSGQWQAVTYACGIVVADVQVVHV